MKYSKNSQITIFIIIGLLIVTTIVLFFFLLKKPQINVLAEENPREYITQCVSRILENNSNYLIENNFYPNRTENMIKYYGELVPYLCSVSLFYTPCVNQEPMLIGKVERQLYDMALPEVENCFKELKKELESKNYVVEEGTLNFELNLKNKAIEAKIDKKITIKRNDETKTYQNFNLEIISPVFRLLDTTRSILNYESETCEFYPKGWMDYYRDIDIRVFSASDQSKVYTLTEKESGKSIKFAVKTCVFPAGI